MEKRLIEFLNSENLNPSKFADRIGVQRSSISHIISGRNKPGFEFLVKITEHFPALNLEWLISGKGKMYKSATTSQQDLYDNVNSNLKLDSALSGSENIEKKQENNLEFDTIGSEEKQESKLINNNVYKSKQYKSDDEIERIVIFFQNKTFKEYLSGS